MKRDPVLGEWDHTPGMVTYRCSFCRRLVKGALGLEGTRHEECGVGHLTTQARVTRRMLAEHELEDLLERRIEWRRRDPRSEVRVMKGEGMAYEEQEYAEAPAIEADLGGGEATQMLAAASKQLDVLNKSIAELGQRVNGVRSQSDNTAPRELLSEAKMPVSSALGKLLANLVDGIEQATTRVQRIREDIAL